MSRETPGDDATAHDGAAAGGRASGGPERAGSGGRTSAGPEHAGSGGRTSAGPEHAGSGGRTSAGPDGAPRGLAPAYAGLRTMIEQAFEGRAGLNPGNSSADLRAAIDTTLALLDAGTLRVAERAGSGWVVNEWLKKAVLLSFRINDNAPMTAEPFCFYDKVPLKFSGWNRERFAAAGVRVVPPATVRRGAFIAAGVVLMPSYVNIGAYVDSGTMVDTWATVGSCAQIGKNVHLSGGVGIGGVLEPLQAAPTIIEDDCFIGARSEIVEGVIVEAGAVVSMGVFIGQSTRIYDRETDTISYGRVPAGAVVVPGSLPAGNGKYSLGCAVIVKRVDARTRAKTSINELLRD